MASYNSSHTGAELDSAVVDLTALLSSGGLGKNLILQNDKRLQGITTGASNRDMIYVDTSNRVHIGEASSNLLHGTVLISATGTPTVTPDAGSDDLVVDGSSNRGMTIVSANNALATINFADPEDNAAAQIRYQHSTDVLTLRVKGTTAFSVDDSQNFTISNGDFKVQSGQWGTSSAESLTISGGAVTATESYITVDTEGAAASDFLDNISAPTAGNGTALIVKSTASTRDVTLRDGIGNLSMAGDFTLSGSSVRIEFQFEGSNWVETSRSDNTL